MADRLSAKHRSWNMSQIISRDTGPEMVVRKRLHKLGFRYRLHRTDLPGKPDIVLSRYRIAIFVHGCFWHQHKGCIDCSNPKTNSSYWDPKLRQNVLRDRRNRGLLRRSGWTPIVIWECEMKNIERLTTRLAKKLQLKMDGAREQ